MDNIAIDIKKNCIVCGEEFSVSKYQKLRTHCYACNYVRIAKRKNEASKKAYVKKHAV